MNIFPFVCEMMIISTMQNCNPKLIIKVGGMIRLKLNGCLPDLSLNSIQRLLLCPCARNFMATAQYWLSPGTGFSIICICRIACLDKEKYNFCIKQNSWIMICAFGSKGSKHNLSDCFLIVELSPLFSLIVCLETLV